jgi:hypothetical protein
MSFVEKWMKSHVGISFITLECVWKFDMEISCKEVAYSYMWIALYIQYCIQHRVSVAIGKPRCKLSCKTLYFFIVHVICILETRIQSSNDVHNFINTSKYSYISIYDGHGLIMMYNAQMFLHSYYVTTCNGS